MSINRKERAEWLGQHVLPYEPMMRAWLQRRSCAGLEIDDIIQETFAILSALESVDEIRNPRNYAFQTAYSIIQRHLRRARIVSFQSFADIDAIEISSEAPSPEAEAADRDDLRSVEKYIAALPKKCREVLILRRIQGLSYREISGRMGISENAVEKLLAKGARLLLDAFGRGGNRTRQASIDERKPLTSEKLAKP